ncbi:putative transmembrane protein, partial [Toxoplasma gondii MAS]
MQRATGRPCSLFLLWLSLFLALLSFSEPAASLHFSTSPSLRSPFSPRRSSASFSLPCRSWTDAVVHHSSSPSPPFDFGHSSSSFAASPRGCNGLSGTFPSSISCSPLPSLSATSCALLSFLRSPAGNLLHRSRFSVQATPRAASPVAPHRLFLLSPAAFSSSLSPQFPLSAGDGLSSTARGAARRTGVAVPPPVAAFGRTLVYAFLKPLRKPPQSPGSPASAGRAEETPEQAAEGTVDETSPRGGKREKESYFRDFDVAYDANEELRRLNDLHKFYAVYTYPGTFSFEESEEDCPEAHGQKAEATSSRLDPPPPSLPTAKRLTLPPTRYPNKALSLFPSPRPRPANSSSSSPSSSPSSSSASSAASSASTGSSPPVPFVPSLSAVSQTAEEDAPLPAPAFPSHALPPNLSAWGGFPLPATIAKQPAAQRRECFLAPSLLGNWIVTQSLARQKAQMLSIFAFDSEASAAKPSEGVGVRTEDMRGISLAGTLAAAAERTPTKEGLRNADAEAQAVAAHNEKVEENLRLGIEGDTLRRERERDTRTLRFEPS